MIAKFGQYAHDDYSVSFVCVKQSQVTQRGDPYLMTVRYDLSGMLIADDVDGVTTKILALEAAYKQRGVDFGIYKSDGSSLTAHKIMHSQTIGGIRVIGPPYYDQGNGAEYTTWRTFKVTLEADIPVGNWQSKILQAQETITTQGGGPELAWTRPLRGKPIKQIVREQRPWRMTQSGFSTIFMGAANANPCIYPELLDEQQISVTSTYDGRTTTATWAYEMSGASDGGGILPGIPTVQLGSTPFNFQQFAPQP